VREIANSIKEELKTRIDFIREMLELDPDE
jgi:hypothetical protein